MSKYKLRGRWKEKKYKSKNQNTVRLPKAPRITIIFHCPSESLGGKIDFLIDTGADVTTIMPPDRKNLNILSYQLEEGEPSNMSGLSAGKVPIKYLHDVEYEFSAKGDNTERLEVDRIGVLDPSKSERKRYHNLDPPSLLGRDFLNACEDITFDDEVILTYCD